MPAFLLDTCAVIWIANNMPLRDPAASELESMSEAKVLVSPISAWEIGMLIANRKIALSIDSQSWFERLLKETEIGLAELSVPVLLSSSNLLESTIKDPADRILIATAREFGYTLVTRDRKILQYAKLGYVKALQC